MRIVGILESVFGPLRVGFGPLKVKFGPLKVNFVSMEGEFVLWLSSFRPLGVDFRSMRVELAPNGEVFLEHFPGGSIGLRALFYLMLLMIFFLFSPT